MLLTPNLGLPYPAPRSPILPTSVQALAEAVDADTTLLDTRLTLDQRRPTIVRTTSANSPNGTSGAEQSLLFNTTIFDNSGGAWGNLSGGSFLQPDPTVVKVPCWVKVGLIGGLRPVGAVTAQGVRNLILRVQNPQFGLGQTLTVHRYYDSNYESGSAFIEYDEITAVLLLDANWFVQATFNFINASAMYVQAGARFWATYLCAAGR